MNFTNLFVERTTCLLYKVTTVLDDAYAGWIGGNPPEDCIESLLDDSLKGHRFYFTFILPETKRQISVFLPDFDEYLEKDIYPNCAIKVIEHAVSPEGDKTKYRMEEFTKHFISFYKETENEETDPVNGEEHFLIKLGGTPELIQNKIRYTEPAEKDGYCFLMQLDEYGYPDGLVKGNVPLGFGALYLYAKQEEKNIKDIMAAFWQAD